MRSLLGAQGNRLLLHTVIGVESGSSFIHGSDIRRALGWGLSEVLLGRCLIDLLLLLLPNEAVISMGGWSLLGRHHHVGSGCLKHLDLATSRRAAHTHSSEGELICRELAESLIAHVP